MNLSESETLATESGRIPSYHIKNQLNNAQLTRNRKRLGTALDEWDSVIAPGRAIVKNALLERYYQGNFDDIEDDSLFEEIRNLKNWASEGRSSVVRAAEGRAIALLQQIYGPETGYEKDDAR